jgi:hypothetical protein
MTEGTRNRANQELHRVLPALTLMIFAPMIAEVLPGATRISSMFVLPIEILVWGGGAVSIRFAVRRFQLGWLNLLLLAMALAVAEEFVIQQTSLAPLVIKIKGVEYARAFGVNYLYFLWALIYESVFVVIIPIGIVELIFYEQRDLPWLNTAGLAIVAFLFLPASFLAWYTWTQIARVEVFHVEAYDPPLNQLAIAAVSVGVLIGLAVGPARGWLARKPKGVRPPRPLVLFLLSGSATLGVFGLELLSFGILPEFPASVGVSIALTLIVLMIVFVPRFRVHESWKVWHEIGMLYGAIIFNMAAFFVAFIDATPIDLYGKIVMNIFAVLLLIWLAAHVRTLQLLRSPGSSQTI